MKKSFSEILSLKLKKINQVLPGELEPFNLFDTMEQVSMPGSYDSVIKLVKQLPSNTLRSALLADDRDCLVIGPCPDYIEELIPYFDRSFDHLILVDNLKAGRSWGGVDIVSSDQFIDMDVEDACFFISTITEPVITLFLDVFPIDSVTTIPRFLFDCCSLGEVADNPTVEEAVECIESNHDAIILLSTAFMTTFIPTIEELRSLGHQVIWLGEHSIDAGYSAVAMDRVPTELAFTMSFPELISVLAKTGFSRQKLLINTESYFHPHWNIKRSCITYTLGASIIDYGKQFSSSLTKWVQFFYDPIKGGNEYVNYDVAATLAYKNLIESSDALIFNSSIEDMGDFVNRSVGVNKPTLHFYRYAYMPTVNKKIDDGERHVAVISTVLNEFHEPSKYLLPEFIKSLLNQSIHIHYYTPYEEFAESFFQELDEPSQSYFHYYPVIFDPRELVNEIQKYHAGLIMSYQHIFGDICATMSDQFMKDALQIFPATTVSTSSLVCAVAGLPLIANRAVHSYPKLYPGTVHSIEFSEAESLGTYMYSDYWNKLMANAKKNQPSFDIINNIKRLDDFLNEL